MEIIHLILGKANPDRMNGVNRAVHHLATSQAQNGMHVSVWGITPTPDSAYPDGRLYTTRLFRSRKSKLDWILRFQKRCGKSAPEWSSISTAALFQSISMQRGC